MNTPQGLLKKKKQTHNISDPALDQNPIACGKKIRPFLNCFFKYLNRNAFKIVFFKLRLKQKQLLLHRQLEWHITNWLCRNLQRKQNKKSVVK